MLGMIGRASIQNDSISLRGTDCFGLFSADVMPLASPKPCSRFIAFFQVAPFQFKVEAIPTKKVRVRTPDFWPVKRPHSSGSENECRTSLDVLPLHVLFLRWHNCRGKIVSTLGNNYDYGILKFLRVLFAFDVPIIRAYYALRMPVVV